MRRVYTHQYCNSIRYGDESHAYRAAHEHDMHSIDGHSHMPHQSMMSVHWPWACQPKNNTTERIQQFYNLTMLGLLHSLDSKDVGTGKLEYTVVLHHRENKGIFPKGFESMENFYKCSARNPSTKIGIVFPD